MWYPAFMSHNTCNISQCDLSKRFRCYTITKIVIIVQLSNFVQKYFTTREESLKILRLYHFVCLLVCQHLCLKQFVFVTPPPSPSLQDQTSTSFIYFKNFKHCKLNDKCIALAQDNRRKSSMCIVPLYFVKRAFDAPNPSAIFKMKLAQFLNSIVNHNSKYKVSVQEQHIFNV